jgi:hypothetical protein
MRKKKKAEGQVKPPSDAEIRSAKWLLANWLYSSDDPELKWAHDILKRSNNQESENKSEDLPNLS